MSMTILPEKNGSAATIRYGMPTTVRLREYAYDAQRKFSCREMASELIGDESDSDSAGGTTTANSNIYGYVNGNPVGYYDYLCLRPSAFERPHWSSHHVRNGHEKFTRTASHGIECNTMNFHSRNPDRKNRA